MSVTTIDLETKFGPLIGSMISETSALHVYFGEFEAGYLSDDPKIRDVMNSTSTNFYGLVQNLLKEKILVKISTLFSRAGRGNRKTVCLEQAVKKLPNSKHKAELLSELKSLRETTYKEIFKARDKFIAHLDLDVVNGRSDYKIPVDLLRSAIADIERILRSIVDEHGHSETHLVFKPGSMSGGIRSNIRFVKIGLKSENEKLERLRNGTYSPEDLKEIQ